MNRAKKLISLLMALVMVISMTAAIAESMDATTGTITVQNPVQNQTYTAYKIFDVTYNGDAYSYTIQDDSEWFSVVKEYADVEANGLTLTLSADGETYVVTTSNAFSAPSFALALDAAHEGKSGNVLTGAPVPSVEGLDLGYYFVTSTSGALCNLTTTDPVADIYDKNDVPFNKVDDDESVEVGQKVNYTITGKVPDTTGFTTYTYMFKDTMSDGLTFNKDITVYVDGIAIDSSLYTVSYTPNEDAATGFELTIDVMKLQNEVAKDINVKYSATVNESAVTKVENNSATLTYSNDPTNSEKKTTTPKDVETVYTAKVVVDKYVAGSEATKLAGAKFVLYKLEGGTKSYYFYNETDAKVQWVTLTDAELKNALAATPQKVTEKVTDENGAAEFIGLEDGTYYLLETAAPVGYNLLEKAVEVTVDGNEAVVAEGTQKTAEEIAAILTDTVKVANETGTKLPETGGVGTTMLYVGGGALIVIAVALLVSKKRKA